MWKTQKKAVLNILVPPPLPDVPSDHTQQFSPIRNHLNIVAGVVNNNNKVPSLDRHSIGGKVPMSNEQQWQ
jgi:hypothetical protein